MLNNGIMHGNRGMLRGGSTCPGQRCGGASENRSGGCRNRGRDVCRDSGRRIGCGCEGYDNDDKNRRGGCGRTGNGCNRGGRDTHGCSSCDGGERTSPINNGASCPLCARPGMSRTGRDEREDHEGHTPCNPEGMTNCEKLLDQIRAVDFALVELVLYLDAYPHCHEALDTYHKLIARRKGLYAQYEASCGPLTAMGNRSTSSWDWIDKPFPWEYKAN